MMSGLLSDGVVDRAPDPLWCPTCRGDGTVPVRAPGCTHEAANGRCPCGLEDAECPDCEGSGRTGCDHCGEPATTVRHRDVLCAACAAPSEDGWPDAPDYDGMQASARAIDRSGW